MSICFTFTIYMLVNVQSEKKKLCCFYTEAWVGVTITNLVSIFLCLDIWSRRASDPSTKTTEKYVVIPTRMF